MDNTKLKKSLTDLNIWTRKGFADTTEAMGIMAEGKASIQTGKFVASPEEFEQTKNAPPNQGEVFNSWYRFSHTNSDNQPALPEELLTWTYNEGTDTISNTTNSSSFIGVVSKSRYDKYILDVLIDSTSADDDTIGLILAWYIDPQSKKENTLSLVRGPGGNGQSSLYSIFYNYRRLDQKVIAQLNNLVTWGNGQPGSMSIAEAGYVTNTPGWNGLAAYHSGGRGAKLKVERNEDLITIGTSQWGTPTVIDPATSFTLDLNSDPVLAKFRGARPYGFCSASQPNCTWAVQNFTNPQDRLYNLKTNEVYEYIDDVWTLVPGATIDDIGERTYLYNSVTKKMFYMHDPGSIVRIGTADL